MSLLNAILAAQGGNGGGNAGGGASPSSNIRSISDPSTAVFGFSQPTVMTNPASLTIYDPIPLAPVSPTVTSIAYESIIRFPVDDDNDMVYPGYYELYDGDSWGNNLLGVPNQHLTGKGGFPYVGDADHNDYSGGNYVGGADDTGAIAGAFDSGNTGTSDTTTETYNWLGNHGFSCTQITCSAGHGKGPNDIGSSWTCTNGHTWFIARIFSSTVLQVISENRSTTGLIAIWHYNELGTSLTHVANADNTATFAIDVAIEERLNGICSNDTRWYVNGVLIDVMEPKVYPKVYALTVTQTSIFFDPWSALQYVVDNRPSGAGYTTQPNLRHGTPLLQTDYVVDFQEAGKFMLYNYLKVLDTFKMNSWAVQQQEWKGYLGGPPNLLERFDSIIRRIPSLLPVNDGAKTLDFRLGCDYQDQTGAGVYNAQTQVLSDKWEDGNAPRRHVEVYKTSGTPVIVNNFGFIPAWDDEDFESKWPMAPYLFGSKKIYPGAVQFSTSATGGNVLDADTAYKFAVFRGWDKVPTTAGVLNYMARRYLDGSIYVVADFDTAGSYSFASLHAASGSNLSISGKTFTAHRLKNATVDGDDITVTADDYAHVEGWFA